jgi:hypothetical protein
MLARNAAAYKPVLISSGEYYCLHDVLSVPLLVMFSRQGANFVAEL